MKKNNYELNEDISDIQEKEFLELLKEFEQSEEYQEGLANYLSSNNCEDYYESEEYSKAFKKFLKRVK